MLCYLEVILHGPLTLTQGSTVFKKDAGQINF